MQGYMEKTVRVKKIYRERKKNEASITSLEEVEGQIRQNLIQQKQNQAYGEKSVELRGKYLEK